MSAKYRDDVFYFEHKNISRNALTALVNLHKSCE